MKVIHDLQAAPGFDDRDGAGGVAFAGEFDRPRALRHHFVGRHAHALDTSGLTGIVGDKRSQLVERGRNSGERRLIGLEKRVVARQDIAPFADLEILRLPKQFRGFGLDLQRVRGPVRRIVHALDHKRRQDADEDEERQAPAANRVAARRPRYGKGQPRLNKFLAVDTSVMIPDAGSSPLCSEMIVVRSGDDGNRRRNGEDSDRRRRAVDHRDAGGLALGTGSCRGRPGAQSGQGAGAGRRATSTPQSSTCRLARTILIRLSRP